MVGNKSAWQKVWEGGGGTRAFCCRYTLPVSWGLKGVCGQWNLSPGCQSIFRGARMRPSNLLFNLSYPCTPSSSTLSSPSPLSLCMYVYTYVSSSLAIPRYSCTLLTMSWRALNSRLLAESAGPRVHTTVTNVYVHNQQILLLLQND